MMKAHFGSAYVDYQQSVGAIAPKLITLLSFKIQNPKFTQGVSMMAVVQKLADAFHMTDEVWAHHANPWSVWTRYGALPFLIVAIWSRVWWGWGALLPTAIVLVWIWLNPRVFSKPTSTNNWASKAVLGERVWLNRQQVPIPAHHHPVILFTNLVNAIGFLVCSWGLISFTVWPTLLGLSWVILGKTWFLDRMVWLFDEMEPNHSQYQQWLYSNPQSVSKN